jgi:hypothetical protein
VALGASFALAPWLTLGFGTPIAFILAAVLFRHLGKPQAVVLRLSAAVYTAVVVVAFTQSDSATGSAGDYVFWACLLISIVGGGIQALVFAVAAARRGYRPALAAARPGDADPAVPTQGRAARVVTTIGVIIVVALFPAIVFILIDDTSFQRHHRDAQVTITSVRINTDCTGWPVPTCTDQFYPTVRFTTPQGETSEVETRDFRTEDTSVITAGRTITVHFDPNEPSDVRLGTGWGNDDVVLIALGIVTYGCFGFIVVRSRRRRRHPPASTRRSDVRPDQCGLQTGRSATR